MLRIEVPISESFDESTSKFVTNYFTLEMEHSLVSLSKWEAKFEKPFLSDAEKTGEEVLTYYQFMTLTPDVPLEIYYKLSEKNVAEINDYINAKQTATWFTDTPGQARSREVITAEIIRYWMITLKIPIELETWHLGRLFTQIRVVNQKNQPAKKMNRSDMLAQRAQLNAKRRAELGTKG